MSTVEGRLPTEQECIEAAGRVLAEADVAVARMTAREQAEAAWTPTSPLSVDELEDEIRASRGIAPLRRDGGDRSEVRPGDGT